MSLGKIILTSIAFWQGREMLEETLERQRKAYVARDVADLAGKPLLVVGGPWGTSPFRHLMRIPAHECGDVCIDAIPSACEGCPCIMEADIRDIPFPDGAFGAALVCHVLEHLPTVEDCKKAVAELYRVSDQVFVASPSKRFIIAWLHPDHHLWVRQDEIGITIEQR